MDSFIFVIELNLWFVMCAASLALFFFLRKKWRKWLPARGLVMFCGRYNFIFSRFNPEAYFFALILNFRNFLIGILPILLVAYNELQYLGPNLERMCPTGGMTLAVGFSSILNLYAVYCMSIFHAFVIVHCILHSLASDVYMGVGSCGGGFWPTRHNTTIIHM